MKVQYAKGNVVAAPSLPLFSQASSDPHVIDVMGKAYAKACKMLHDRGQPSIVQEVIAQRIVEIAKTGERNPDLICDRVLTDLGLRRES